jgi:tetratricopeptide (TPR) repeat protein
VKRDRFAKTPERRALLDALVSERLLVADRDGRVRVAHEALLRRWARAQDILMAERDFLHVRDRLAPLAADWQAKTEVRDAKADDYLLPAGPLLSAFEALKAHGRDADLPDDIRTFAARSSVAAKRAASRKVRNLRITVAGLSALTLAALVASVIAWQQWQTAQRHFELALGAATGIVYDLARGLREIMRADTVARILGTAEGVFEGLLRALPDDPRLLREQSVMLDEFATTYQTQGDLGRALKSYQASLAIRERLADADPGNAGWQYDLGISNERVGNVLAAQGRLAEALGAYQARHNIIEHLADADPGNAGWQRDLSVSHNKIGDVLVEQGDLAQALKSYQASLAIAQRLADADPGNAGWQHDVALSLQRVGFVAALSQDHAGALAAWRQGLGIVQRLVTLAPDYAAFQRDRAWFEARIAELGG